MKRAALLRRFAPRLQQSRTQSGGTRARAWLYLITDGRMQGHTDDLVLLNKVEGALKAGVRLVQLREKALTGEELLRVAVKLRKLTLKHGAGLIINTDLEVAKKCGANGVHLPGAGLNIEAARASVGNKALIGVSTHSVKEAGLAHASGADFITFGPLYFTESKARYGKPVGVAKLREAARIGIPVFGLGGIGCDETAEVLGAGAAGIGVISAIFSRTDTQRATEELLRRLEKYSNERRTD